MYSDVYNTTVNVNGKTMFSSTYYPGYCCCGPGMFMNSCFGFGFGGFGGGFGFGTGYAVGMAAFPLMPALFKGIGKGVSAVAKGVKNLWNNIFHKKSKTKTEESQKA